MPKKNGGYGNKAYDYTPGASKSMDKMADEYSHDSINPKTSDGGFYRPSESYGSHNSKGSHKGGSGY